MVNYRFCVAKHECAIYIPADTGGVEQVDLQEVFLLWMIAVHGAAGNKAKQFKMLKGCFIKLDILSHSWELVFLLQTHLIRINKTTVPRDMFQYVICTHCQRYCHRTKLSL